MQFNAINGGGKSNSSNDVFQSIFPNDLGSSSSHDSVNSIHYISNNEKNRFFIPFSKSQEQKSFKIRPKAAYKVRTPHNIPLPIIKTPSKTSDEILNEPQKLEDLESDYQLSSVGSTPSENTIQSLPDCVETKNEIGYKTKLLDISNLRREKMSNKGYFTKSVAQRFPQITNPFSGDSVFIKTNRIPYDQDEANNSRNNAHSSRKMPFSVSFSLSKNEVIEDFQSPKSSSKDFKIWVKKEQRSSKTAKCDGRKTTKSSVEKLPQIPSFSNFRFRFDF